jgi:hypothetical protein
MLEHTPEFWASHHNEQGFQWGASSPEFLAEAVASRAPSGVKSVFVAGAGMSRDAYYIKNTMKLPQSAVLASDVFQKSVDFQQSLRVTDVLADATVRRQDWVGAFDVVIDTSLVDVFLANWHKASDCYRYFYDSY